MKIAVLSDTRLPTSAEFPGHGLGKMNLAAANGLAERGHEVTLYAGPGSAHNSLALVIADDERAFKPDGFDAILDGTHGHTLQKTMQDAKIVNWSHDREAHPGRCAIYPSRAHAAYFEAKQPRIVLHGIVVTDIPEVEVPGEYVAYMSDFVAHKGPIMAWNAARLAGVPLMMAGRGGMKLPGAEYLGALAGEEKRKFLAKAKCLIFPASIEAAGITLLEAQAMGCPVIVSTHGAAKEYAAPACGRVENTDEMARAIELVSSVERATCRQFVIEKFSANQMIDGLEMALKDAADGKVW